MQSFIKTFSNIIIEPPTISDLIPTDLTAIQPAKQIYCQYQHDQSQQSKIVKKKVQKLINILQKNKILKDTIPKEQKIVNNYKNSKTCQQDDHYVIQPFVNQQKNQNCNYINRIHKKPEKICQLMRVQYRKNTHLQITPIKKKLDLSNKNQYNIQVRRVTPKCQKQRTPTKITKKQQNKKKIQLLDSFALKQQQNKIINQISQLQNKLQIISYQHPTPKQKLEKQVKELEIKSKNTKTVRLDISPSKMRTEKCQKKNIMGEILKKQNSKKLLLTNRINKTIRS